MFRLRVLLQLGLLLSASAWTAQAQVPEDFPRFTVPGHDQETASVRALFWLHYPGAGPKATLWDEWHETGNRVTLEIICRPGSSSDRRLRELFHGERGLPFKKTEEL